MRQGVHHPSLAEGSHQARHLCPADLRPVRRGVRLQGGAKDPQEDALRGGGVRYLQQDLCPRWSTQGKDN